MEIGFTHCAGEFDRFAPGCFDRIVGTEIPFTVEGRPIGKARVIAVDVTSDGRAVELTVDAPAEAALFIGDGHRREFSFGTFHHGGVLSPPWRQAERIDLSSKPPKPGETA